MKQTLLLILIIFVSNLHAQITVTNASFPVAGDTLFTAVDNLPSNIDIQAPGGDLSWDFTTLQAPFTRSNLIRPATEGNAYDQFPDAELIINLSDNVEGYVNVTDDIVELIGYNGTDPLGQGIEVTARFDPPLIPKTGPHGTFLMSIKTSLHWSSRFQRMSFPANC